MGPCVGLSLSCDTVEERETVKSDYSECSSNAGGGDGGSGGSMYICISARIRKQLRRCCFNKNTWMEALWLGIPEDIEIRTVSGSGKKTKNSPLVQCQQ